MPETDADRILRERNRQNTEWYRKKQAIAKRQAKLMHKQYIAYIDAEIKVVLKLLVELKYPFMEEVSVPNWPTGRFTKAGWGIGYSEDWCRDGWISYPIYLLSDGRLYSRDRVGSPKRIIGLNDNSGCLKGLQQLRGKLEEMKKHLVELVRVT